MIISSEEKRSVGRGALALGFLFAALLVAGSLTERSAHALPILYVVNSTTDDGNGPCTASECTLREAIDAANDSPEKDAIRFDIPGGMGSRPSSPNSELPTITDPVDHRRLHAAGGQREQPEEGYQRGAQDPAQRRERGNLRGRAEHKRD